MQKMLDGATADSQPIQFESVADPTICFNCGADNGSTEYSQVAGLHCCPTCMAALYNRPFPGWLRLALATLLILLGVSLVHGAKYFRAGSSLVKSERLIEQQKFTEAIPHLQKVVGVAPDCEKCILLLAKAQFLTGMFAEAWSEIEKHNGGNFEESALTREVSKIADRVSQAVDKVEEAGQMAAEEKWEEAAQTMREAARQYPESVELDDAVSSYEIAAAFERKDYDAFLRIAEAGWERRPDSFLHAGQLASALACKFAVSNDPAFRSRSEELLEKSRQLAATPDEKQFLQEYEERIQHRLRTRVIIDTEEYNRRFRRKTAEGKQ